MTILLISMVIGALVAKLAIWNTYQGTQFSNLRDYAIDSRCDSIGFHLGWDENVEKREEILTAIQNGDIGVI
jgi:hypothetical protein